MAAAAPYGVDRFFTSVICWPDHDETKDRARTNAILGPVLDRAWVRRGSHAQSFRTGVRFLLHEISNVGTDNVETLRPDFVLVADHWADAVLAIIEDLPSLLRIPVRGKPVVSQKQCKMCDDRRSNEPCRDQDLGVDPRERDGVLCADLSPGILDPAIGNPVVLQISRNHASVCVDGTESETGYAMSKTLLGFDIPERRKPFLSAHGTHESVLQYIKGRRSGDRHRLDVLYRNPGVAPVDPDSFRKIVDFLSGPPPPRN